MTRPAKPTTRRSKSRDTSPDDLLSVMDAATELGISKPRVHQLINEGVIPVIRVGNAFVIRRSDLATARDRNRQPGRPRTA